MQFILDWWTCLKVGDTKSYLSFGYGQHVILKSALFLVKFDTLPVIFVVYK